MGLFDTFNLYCRSILEKGTGQTIQRNLLHHKSRLQTPLHTFPPARELSKKIQVKRWRDFQNHEDLLIDLENELQRTAAWAIGQEELEELIRKEVYDKNAKRILYFRSGANVELNVDTISSLESISISESSLGRVYCSDTKQTINHKTYPAISSNMQDMSDYFQNKFGFDPNIDESSILEKHNRSLKNNLLQADFLLLEAAFAVSEGGLFGFYDSDGMLMQMIDKVGKGIIILSSGDVHADQEVLEESNYERSRNRTGNPWYPNTLMLKGKNCLEHFKVIIYDEGQPHADSYHQSFYFPEAEHKQLYDPLFLTTGNILNGYNQEDGFLKTNYCLLDGWKDQKWPFQGDSRKRNLTEKRELVEKKLSPGKERIMMKIWKRTMMKRSRLNKTGRTFFNSLFKQYLLLNGAPREFWDPRATKSFNAIWQEKHQGQ